MAALVRAEPVKVALQAGDLSFEELGYRIGFSNGNLSKVARQTVVRKTTYDRIMGYLALNWPAYLKPVPEEILVLMPYKQAAPVLPVQRTDAEPEPKSKMRPCLKCQILFLSEGSHNRLCNCCKKKNASLGAEWF